MGKRKLPDNIPAEGFIKITKPDSSGLKPDQKAALNRKGIELLNSKQYEKAKRVFLTTGYTAGLIRLGDYYYETNNYLEALRMYWAAPAEAKKQKILEEMAGTVRKWLQDAVEMKTI